jgi:hypothetical protein
MAEDVIGLLGPARLAQRGGDRVEDQAAGLRHAIAEPRHRALPGTLGLVEPPERQQRLDLDDDDHRQQVRVRVVRGGEQVRGVLGVGERLCRAPAQSRISDRVQLRTASANWLRGAKVAAVAKPAAIESRRTSSSRACQSRTPTLPKTTHAHRRVKTRSSMSPHWSASAIARSASMSDSA